MVLQRRQFILLKTYWETPISNFPYSPNQMLFSWQIRTRVPVHSVMLVPQICHDTPALLERRQTKYKDLYDRQGSKQLLLLKEGDSVGFKKPDDKHLSPAVVKGKHETPRSYLLLIYLSYLLLMKLAESIVEIDVVFILLTNHLLL